MSNDSGELIRETFLSTDKRMVQFDTEGCTATAVWFWEYNGTRYVQTGNVGDSSAFLWYILFIITFSSTSLILISRTVATIKLLC